MWFNIVICGYYLNNSTKEISGLPLLDDNLLGRELGQMIGGRLRSHRGTFHAARGSFRPCGCLLAATARILGARRSITASHRFRGGRFSSFTRRRSTVCQGNPHVHPKFLHITYKINVQERTYLK